MMSKSLLIANGLSIQQFQIGPCQLISRAPSRPEKLLILEIVCCHLGRSKAAFVVVGPPLPAQAVEKIVKPTWNGVSFAEIGPSKREQMTEQYLPLRVHVRKQRLQSFRPDGFDLDKTPYTRWAQSDGSRASYGLAPERFGHAKHSSRTGTAFMKSSPG